MPADSELQLIKQRIAAVYDQREALKRALERGDIAPRTGFAQLEAVDQTLSSLDSRFNLETAVERSLSLATLYE